VPFRVCSSFLHPFFPFNHMLSQRFPRDFYRFLVFSSTSHSFSTRSHGYAPFDSMSNGVGQRISCRSLGLILSTSSDFVWSCLSGSKSSRYRCLCVATVCLAAPAECSLCGSSGSSSTGADWSFRPAAFRPPSTKPVSAPRACDCSPAACWTRQISVEAHSARQTRFLVNMIVRVHLGATVLFSSLCLRDSESWCRWERVFGEFHSFWELC